MPCAIISGQIDNGDTVALFFEGRKNTTANRDFVLKGVEEARRKNISKGHLKSGSLIKRKNL